MVALASLATKPSDRHLLAASWPFYAGRVMVRFLRKNQYLRPLSSVLLNLNHVWFIKTSSRHVLPISVSHVTIQYHCDNHCDTTSSQPKCKKWRFFGQKCIFCAQFSVLANSKFETSISVNFYVCYKFGYLRSGQYAPAWTELERHSTKWIFLYNFCLFLHVILYISVQRPI